MRVNAVWEKLATYGWGRLTDKEKREIRLQLAGPVYDGFILPDAVRLPKYSDVYPQSGMFHCQVPNQCGAGEHGHNHLRCREDFLTLSITKSDFFEFFVGLSEQFFKKAEFAKVAIVRIPCDFDATQFFADEIDLSILLSKLWDSEEFLVADGQTKVSLYACGLEIQLDDHKLIHVFARDINRFDQIKMILEDRMGLKEIQGARLISEDRHVHVVDEKTSEYEFERLLYFFGAERPSRKNKSLE